MWLQVVIMAAIPTVGGLAPPWPEPARVPMLLIGLGFLRVRRLALFWQIIAGRATGFNKVDEAEESLHLAKELREEVGANGGAK